DVYGSREPIVCVLGPGQSRPPRLWTVSASHGLRLQRAVRPGYVRAPVTSVLVRLNERGRNRPGTPNGEGRGWIRASQLPARAGPCPAADDCPPWPAGSSGDGSAVAAVDALPYAGGAKTQPR